MPGITDRIGRDHPTETEDDLRKKLADDYLFGFDTGDDVQQRYVGTLIANGWCPEEDIKDLRRLSLLRGAEQWHQMLCCAKSLRDKAHFDNPLDGQDLLTFLSEVLGPRLGPSDQVLGEQTSNTYLEGAGVVKSHCTKSGAGTEHNSEKGKIHKPSKRETNGKHARDKKSPFWSVTGPPSSNHQVLQSVDEKRRLEKERRKTRRVIEYQVSHNPNPIPAPASVQLPGLSETREANRSKGNDSALELIGSSPTSILHERSGAPFKEHHSQMAEGSMSGTSINNPLPHISIESEGLLQSSPSSTHSHSKAITDAAGVNLGPSNTSNQLVESPKEYGMYPPRAQVHRPKQKAKSPYFETIDTADPLETRSSRPPRGTVSCIPFPRLDAPNFGLVQEELAGDPFRLLIAVTFLIRVKGKQAIPVFHQLVSRYPTPRDLAEADTNDIVAMIRHLGLAEVRAFAIQKYARMWMENPPQAGVRYGVKNYSLGDGADIQVGDALGPDDPSSSGWEIGHMTQGRYAIDSWRIFCRDVLLGRAEDWRGRGREGEFQPEWMRVCPEDKELRALCRWLWMQEGWVWDPRTGEREVLSEDLRRAVDEGRIDYDNTGDLIIKSS